MTRISNPGVRVRACPLPATRAGLCRGARAHDYLVNRPSKMTYKNEQLRVIIIYIRHKVFSQLTSKASGLLHFLVPRVSEDSYKKAALIRGAGSRGRRLDAMRR